MSKTPIYLERRNQFADLVINRPEKRNALTLAMWQAVPALVSEAGNDPSIRILRVVGMGGAFASGADIDEFEEVYATRESAEAYSLAISSALDSIADCPKPTIAQIDGACVGGGCGIALACDLRFASANSRFGVTPAKLGLAYPHNDTRRLIDAIGVAHAKDLLYSARLVDAAEAADMGLINKFLDAGELENRVLDYIRGMLTRSSQSAITSKRMIRLIRAGEHEETEETRQLFLDAFLSEDFQEGYRAFLEKRAPVFANGDKDD